MACLVACVWLEFEMTLVFWTIFLYGDLNLSPDKDANWQTEARCFPMVLGRLDFASGKRIPHRRSLLRPRGTVKAFLNPPKGIKRFCSCLASSWGRVQGGICTKFHAHRKLPSCFSSLRTSGPCEDYHPWSNIIGLQSARFSSHVRRVQKERRGELSASCRLSMARYSFRVPFRKDISWVVLDEIFSLEVIPKSRRVNTVKIISQLRFSSCLLFRWEFRLFFYPVSDTGSASWTVRRGYLKVNSLEHRQPQIERRIEWHNSFFKNRRSLRTL